MTSRSRSIHPIGRPEWLSEMAAAEWDRIGPHLASMGTVKGSDEAILAAYCECYRPLSTAARPRRSARPPCSIVPPQATNRCSIKNPVYSQLRDAEASLRVLAR